VQADINKNRVESACGFMQCLNLQHDETLSSCGFSDYLRRYTGGIAWARAQRLAAESKAAAAAAAATALPLHEGSDAA
jgi:hypothetical protein